MSGRRILAAALVLVLLGMAAAFIWRLQADEQPVQTPQSEVQEVRITDARLVMPAAAGNPAALYFTVTNTGQEHAQLGGVQVAQAGRAGFMEVKEAAEVPSTRVAIAPGETVRLAADTGTYVAVADYNEDVVPGSNVDVVLTLTSGQVARFKAPVEVARALAPGGR